MAVDTSQFRNGLKVEIDGEPYVMTYFQHVKPGKGGAFVRTKIKNLRTGRVLERTFRSGERLDEAEVEDKKMQYLYQDGEHYVFMDKENYEQLTLEADFLEGQAGYLLPNSDVQINFYNGRAIGVELPPSVVLEVVDTEPGIKNSTATNSFKPAKMETGITVQVPPFINKGEKIKIDTAEGKYMERA